MDDDSITLRLSAQRALWGHVPACMRAASIQKEGDTIFWRCVFDAEATDDDFELASNAGAESIADFSAPTVIDEQVLKLPFPKKLEHLKHLIFLRHEHNYYKDSAEQPGTGQPATRPVDKPESSDKPQPEAEGRSR